MTLKAIKTRIYPTVQQQEKNHGQLRLLPFRLESIARYAEAALCQRWQLCQRVWYELPH